MASIQQRSDSSFLLIVELDYDGRGKRIRRTRTIKVEDKSLLSTKNKSVEYLEHKLHKFKIEIEVWNIFLLKI